MQLKPWEIYNGGFTVDCVFHCSIVGEEKIFFTNVIDCRFNHKFLSFQRSTRTSCRKYKRLIDEQPKGKTVNITKSQEIFVRGHVDLANVIAR